MNISYKISNRLKLNQRLEIIKNLCTSKFIPNKMEAIKRILSYRKSWNGINIYMDIGDVCNSKCLFCSTGIKNRNGCPPQERGHFMDFDLFKNIMSYLEDKMFLQAHQHISLFNWGEPMIHPELERMIGYLTQRKRKIFLSTNGIFMPEFSEKFDASCISFFRISMCGFSQKSYDKIFMSNFEQCKRNIAKLVKTFREHGFIGYFTLIFHVYQFNTHEIKAAAEFARQLHIGFWPIWAFLVDGERTLKFAKQELPADYLTKMAQYLFFGGHDRGPVNECRLNEVCINPDGNVNRCCLFRETIGNIFDMTPEIWKERCDACKLCVECKKAGVPRFPCEDNDEFDLRSLSYYL